MADIKFNLVLDKNNIKKQIKDLFGSGKKLGVDVKGKGGAGKDKTSTTLGQIASKVAIIAAVIASLKPITDLIKVLLGFIAIMILKLIKSLPDIIATVTFFIQDLIAKIIELKDQYISRILELRDRIVEKFVELRDKIIGLRDRIVEKFIELRDKILELKDRLVEKFIELRDRVVSKLIDVKDKIVEKLIEFREKALSLWEKIKDKIINLVATIKDKLKLLKDKLIEFKNLAINKFESFVTTVKELPGKIWAFIKEGFNNLINAIKKLSIRDLLGGSRQVNDAIITKKGEVIETSPNDTLIATKSPGGGMGGNKTFIFNGVTPQEMIDIIKRELADETTTFGRF